MHMDPNASPRKMRILSYVMTKIPSFKRKQLQELENDRFARPSALPETYTELSERESYTELAERVAHLTDDDISTIQIASQFQFTGNFFAPILIQYANSSFYDQIDDAYVD
ncbi:hypothetical protein QVD17_20781 [Tagetes erecta]|uniref:Uncharacterized protein n=1 Tax=Tagetes erecta TaxID=13708 RepID=A0AAD8KLV0_TARER|nr:hypothetical protein QVD17_20781 [Tagetes erecta]